MRSLLIQYFNLLLPNKAQMESPKHITNQVALGWNKVTTQIKLPQKRIRIHIFEACLEVKLFRLTAGSKIVQPTKLGAKAEAKRAWEAMQHILTVLYGEMQQHYKWFILKKLKKIMHLIMNILSGTLIQHNCLKTHIVKI